MRNNSPTVATQARTDKLLAQLQEDTLRMREARLRDNLPGKIAEIQAKHVENQRIVDLLS